MRTCEMKTSESTNIKSFISQLQWGQDRSSLARSTWSLSTPVPLLLLAGQLFISNINSLRKMHLFKEASDCAFTLMYNNTESCLGNAAQNWRKNFQQKDNWETQSNQRDSFITEKVVWLLLYPGRIDIYVKIIKSLAKESLGCQMFIHRIRG